MVFKNIAVLGEFSTNSQNDLLRTNVYKTLEFWWQLLSTKFQWSNITSVISK